MLIETLTDQSLFQEPGTYDTWLQHFKYSVSGAIFFKRTKGVLNLNGFRCYTICPIKKVTSSSVK